MSISIILVPQGAEYQAVSQGAKRTNFSSQSIVVPIPLGTTALGAYLEQSAFTNLLAKYEHPQVVLMGVCGSLQSAHTVGDVVVYQECIYQPEAISTFLTQICDVDLTATLMSKCEQSQAKLVRALTSDRLISQASEKLQLGQTYKADVVDMEGYIALKLLSQKQCRVAMIRVVSDACDRDLPDISQAFQADGTIQPLVLANKMMRQPIAALHLITGSLKALKILREVASKLVT